MRRAAKKDANHNALVQALGLCGWLVDETHRTGDGFPDAVATRADVTRLVEFKGTKGTLTPAQVRFASRHRVDVIRSLDDVVRLR